MDDETTTQPLTPLQIAIEALNSIALAGMSGSGQESEEGMRDWHARRAWDFIAIAARAKMAIAATRPAERQMGEVESVRRGKVAHVKWWADAYEREGGHGVVVAMLREFEAALTAPPAVAQQAEPKLPAGWVPCTITYEEGEDPEEVAFGPQLMMSRLKKWLDAYFAKVWAERYPAASPQPTKGGV